MKKHKKPPVLVPVDLRLRQESGRWKAEFSSDDKVHLENSDGDFDFQQSEKAIVVLSLRDSPGVAFFEDPDLCIGFARDVCPDKPDAKDSDVFKYISVSEDRRSLSFLNMNKPKSGIYFYTLFLTRDEAVIPVDPRIINK